MTVPNGNAITRCGFVGVAGRPNSGKSTFLNGLVGSNLAMVSKKANATRKRMNFIVHNRCKEYDAQIIFVDTPGISKGKKLLDKYMRHEYLKAVSSSDVCLFMVTASRSEEQIESYKEFLTVCKVPHIVILNKVDRLSNAEVMSCISKYVEFQDKFLALIPFSATKMLDGKFDREIGTILDLVSRNIPISPHLYDPSFLSTSSMREIYKEAIREAIFERLSDEIPYESDVLIVTFTERESVDVVSAHIVVEKDSQRKVAVGKGGSVIKAIGTIARNKCELISGKTVHLSLVVKTHAGWSKMKDNLKKFGYNFADVHR